MWIVFFAELFHYCVRSVIQLIVVRRDSLLWEVVPDNLQGFHRMLVWLPIPH